MHGLREIVEMNKTPPVSRYRVQRDRLRQALERVMPHAPGMPSDVALFAQLAMTLAEDDSDAED